jgi:hypothetical protein
LKSTKLALNSHALDWMYLYLSLHHQWIMAIPNKLPIVCLNHKHQLGAKVFATEKYIRWTARKMSEDGLCLPASKI